MKKEQETYIRYLRLMLGNAIRKADDVVKPLKEGLERGFRWEPDDVLNAMLATDELGEASEKVAAKIADLLKRADFSTAERERLQGAKNGVSKAAVFLGSIKGKEMIALEEKWLSGKVNVHKGHEAYFLKRFEAAIKLLRLSWNKMFYATHKVRPRRMTMSARESSGFYNPMSDVAKHIRSEADHVADRSGTYVEVYDDDGDIAYIAQPPVEHMTRAASMAKNPDGRADHEMMRALWAMSY
jgi:hypothetical protein